MAGRERYCGRSLVSAALMAGLSGLALHVGCATAAAESNSVTSAGSDHSELAPDRAVLRTPTAAATRPGTTRRDSRGERTGSDGAEAPTARPSALALTAAGSRGFFLEAGAVRQPRVHPPAVARVAAAAEPQTPWRDSSDPGMAAPAVISRPAAAVSTPAVRPPSESTGTVPPSMRVVQEFDAMVAQAFDATAERLGGLPANGLTELLQGVLLMVRDAWAEARLGRWPGSIFSRVPRYDHVVVVVLENHGPGEILGISDTDQPPVPYINNVLVPGAALMTASYGLQHPSQPNYYWLFSGSNQGITTDEPPILPDGTNTVNSTARNLYTELQALCRPKTFIGYVEGYEGSADLTSPGGVFSYSGTIASEPGTTGELDNVVRHMPWAGFANVPENVTVGFSSFGPDYDALPDVSFVIPALQHDMHNFDFGAAAENSDITTSDTSMANADAWLQQQINGYAQWALTHNSLLIVTTDEDSTADWITPPLTEKNYHGPQGELAITPGAPGFTSSAQGPSATAENPSGAAQSGPNPIFTLFYGAHVVPGAYSNPITNVNVLRTIEAAMGIRTKAGAQPAFVGTTAAGRHDPAFRFNDRAVTNVFSWCAW